MNFYMKNDINYFKQDIFRLIARTKVGAICGRNSSMKGVKDDCLTKVPKCPVDTGKLASEHHIMKTVEDDNKVVGVLLVTTPYAASIHGGISRYGKPYQYRHAPNEGAFWGMSKLLMYGDQYINTIVNSIVG